MNLDGEDNRRILEVIRDGEDTRTIVEVIRDERVKRLSKLQADDSYVWDIYERIPKGAEKIMKGKSLTPIHNIIRNQPFFHGIPKSNFFWR